MLSSRSTAINTATSLVQEVEMSLKQIHEFLRDDNEQPDRLTESLESIQKLTAELTDLLSVYRRETVLSNSE